MRPQRLLIVASLTVLAAGSLAACASANPGWTYQPAPVDHSGTERGSLRGAERQRATAARS